MNKNPKYARFVLLLGLFSILALLIAACSGSDTAKNSADTEQEYQVALPAVGSNPPAEEQADEAYPAPEIEPSVQDAAAASEAYPAPEAPAEAPAPQPRTALEATNPADVSLTSGNLQLVEMFAFW